MMRQVRIILWVLVAIALLVAGYLLTRKPRTSEQSGVQTTELGRNSAGRSPSSARTASRSASAS